MALRNKDGSIYQLQKPNPMMKYQNIWDNEKLILHNMKWESEKAEDKTEVQPIKSDIQVKDNFIQELKETKQEEEKKPEEEPVFERKTVVAEDTKRIEEEKKPEIEKVFVHCLPATIRTKTDELYGETYQTIQYGVPTSFEAVVLEELDLTYSIWTDTDQITAGSVLFPKTNNKRWWKVKNKTPKANGWIINCVLSDYQPSFDK